MLPGVRTPKEPWHSFPASVINYKPQGAPLLSLAISTCLKGPDPAAQNRWHKVWEDSVADSSASACPGSSMHLGASSLPGLSSLTLAPRQPVHRPLSCAGSFLSSLVSGCYLPGCWGWPPASNSVYFPWWPSWFLWPEIPRDLSCWWDSES